MLFMSKQVSLPKISLILQKMKIGQNSIYTLFAFSPSIVFEVLYFPKMCRLCRPDTIGDYLLHFL